ncbi:heme/hemin ABC transporter substrate-binding protein [Chitinophaga nivalis]|uniref:Hemin ABC transporter substrate-binding protein n=1 Tax=Chitinophaga nivalis TaxID=2991709 RepID=A0ABT3IT91_9BACT|nr:hemin ABC transporter substrate-binding protein [Chitinophaga nivalis]MCW3463108.1 hemin ABC transporter substrate-binding protein [Chitinophaga nivalis]MCW3487202.1 hemin ABC transporter substrate-binding protein [Chitinophaga nivalis]
MSFKLRCSTVLFLLCLQIGVSVSTYAQSSYKRIVSLNGTVTEILCDLGFQQQIVGVDVTSIYPAAMEKVPKVGHNRNISAEPVLALQPDLILSTANFLSPAVIAQFKSVGIANVIVEQDYSVAGTKKLITQIAAALNVPAKGTALCKQIDQQQAALHIAKQNKKVLFIYARGAGTMMVAGEGTPMDKMITLAGAANAATGFHDFKPLTAEALVAANPDVVLLFDIGLQSLGGVDGLLKVPGVAQTNAGKNRKVIVMDGLLLSGFGPRVIPAIKELSQKIGG